MVVRYFGGTLLGVSGLITAYKLATADALANATIIEKTVKEFFEIKFDYLQMNDVMKIIKDENLEIQSQHFELNCSLVFSVRKNNSVKVEQMFKKMSNIEMEILNSTRHYID